jgi:hypothetical protein
MGKRLHDLVDVDSAAHLPYKSSRFFDNPTPVSGAREGMTGKPV